MIDFSKPVTRTAETEGGRELVVRLTTVGVLVREKGKRKWYGPLPWGHIYDRTARLTAEADMQERATTKRTRKATRNLLRKT